MRKSALFPVLIGTILLMTGLIIICVMVLKHKPETVDNHNYVSTIVVDKYKNDGYAGLYIYKDTEYIVVSEYQDENNETRTVTTYCDASVYNTVNIGSSIFYCTAHNKLKIYEN